MRIAVFGCGYVGLTTAVGLAEIGHQVTGVDTDAAKIHSLQNGKVPFYEPGMQELLARNITEKRLQFSTNARLAIQKSDVVFCAVAAPSSRKSITDLSAVLKVASDFALYSDSEKIFINKSTVPVGTSDEIARTIRTKQTKRTPFFVVSNPEFLREGHALKDFFHPDRIVIGLPEGSAANANKEPNRLKLTMRRLFRHVAKNGIPLLFTSLRNAEIIKYASNAFLATKISFVNELAQFCEKAGGDIKEVTNGMRHDPRIGIHFLDAGIGFGGSCLPKDLGVLLRTGKTARVPLRLMKSVKDINDAQPFQVIEKLRKKHPRLNGKKVAVWGVSFKPDTDDLRDAPSRLIVDKLLKLKARVHVFDPVALGNFKKIYGARLEYGKDAYDILKDADALLLLTEWNEFSSPDFKRIKKLMRTPLIVDGRNVYDPAELRAQKFIYSGIGRS
ncbi:MAG TPA: UDP-glucose/GDP-mannose dehydrogenase family protein [Candidatus Gracilibacteria bacterium]|nr:UDP-glucose/GDP-mannose dehydrogenase family protein [Candidatus Gracilibacteria bacterium]